MNFPITKHDYMTTSESDVFQKECSAFIDFIVLITSGFNNREVVENRISLLRSPASTEKTNSNIILNIDAPIERVITYSLIELVNEYILPSSLFDQIMERLEHRELGKKVVA